MKEYMKISNLFEFDANYKTIEGINEPYKTLGELPMWQGTEKVDGTNIRVHWDGHNIEIAGRTDKAEIPSHLLEYLNSVFKTDVMEYLFEQNFGDKEVFLFGEGYGPKIQAGGGLYASTPKFILFDVTINGFELSRVNIDDVAQKLGLRSVPVVFEGTLQEAIEFVSKCPKSTINEAHEMEGIVLTPKIDLFDSKGHRIKCKCKVKDVVKLND